MHPIERLRYVARAGDADPALLAEEAAAALGSLAHDAPALVPACRRLLESHPSCGPLWWVAARLLVAEDAYDAAQLAIRELEDDPTVEELAATFPAGSGVLIPARTSLADAVSLRPDLSVAVLGSPYRLRQILSRIGDSVDAYGIATEDLDDELSGVGLVVVEALAAGPDGFLLDPEQAALATAAKEQSVEVWVVTGVGRVLPAPLFTALCARVVPEDATDPPELDEDFGDLFEPSGRLAPHRSGEHAVFLKAALASAVVGPLGAGLPGVALRRTSCTAPAELLAPAKTR